MVSGNAWIHHGWNGDVVNIRNQVKKPENYSFQKCKEGIPLGTDCFAIPANAEHPGTALTFINFILEPENAVDEHRVHGLPDAVHGPGRDVRRSWSRTTRRSTSRSTTSRTAQQYANLGAAGRRTWDQAWTEIKAG